MSRADIETQLESIFHKIAPEVEFKKLDLNRPLADQADIDSFDFYHILVRVEKEIGVRVPDTVLRSLPNLNGLIDYLEQQKRAYH